MFTTFGNGTSTASIAVGSISIVPMGNDICASVCPVAEHLVRSGKMGCDEVGKGE